MTHSKDGCVTSHRYFDHGKTSEASKKGYYDEKEVGCSLSLVKPRNIPQIMLNLLIFPIHVNKK